MPSCAAAQTALQKFFLLHAQPHSIFLLFPHSHTHIETLSHTHTHTDKRTRAFFLFLFFSCALVVVVVVGSAVLQFGLNFCCAFGALRSWRLDLVETRVSVRAIAHFHIFHFPLGHLPNRSYASSHCAAPPPPSARASFSSFFSHASSLYPLQLITCVLPIDKESNELSEQFSSLTNTEVN